MGKKRRILLAVLLAVVALGGLVWAVIPSGPPEPVYVGKPVSWWLRHRATLFERNPDFILPYTQFDSTAVPFLIKGLETRDGLLQRIYRKVWAKMPLWLHLPYVVPDSEVRQVAAEVLFLMNADRTPAIPALIRALREDEQWSVRISSAYALGRVGNDNKMVTEALIEATNDKDPKVRQAASIALKQLDPEAAAKAGVK